MLVKRARQLSPSAGPRLKIALLGDVSTQHLVPLLRVLFVGCGQGDRPSTPLEEAGLGGACISVYYLDAEVVVILHSIGKLKAKFYEFPGDRSDFTRTKATEIEQVWKVYPQAKKQCADRAEHVRAPLRAAVWKLLDSRSTTRSMA